jgi:urease accessory protein UreH
MKTTAQPVQLEEQDRSSSGMLEAGGVLVGDRVEIEIDVEAVKTAAVQAA